MVGVALAAALIAVSLAGAPLYVSSVSSAAVQDQLRQACGSDSALDLWVPSTGVADVVAAIGAKVPHVQPPVLNTTTGIKLDLPPGVDIKMTLVTREGMEHEFTPPMAPLGENEIALTQDVASVMGVAVGDSIAVVLPNGRHIGLTVAQIVDSIPHSPEPSFWCGYADFLRPNGQGDPPPYWAFASSETQVATGGSFSWEEFRPVLEPLTMHEAHEMSDGYAVANEAHTRRFHDEPMKTSLPTLISRATNLAAAVDKAVAPVRLAGVIASGLVLLAAAVMLAAERRRELRLLALRGVSPWRSALRLVGIVGGPLLAGVAAGWLVAFFAATALGPATQVERGAVLRALVAVALALVVSVLATAACVAFTGDRFVDSGHRRRWWRLVPFELMAVPLAYLSFRRLRSTGGLQLFGVESRGGELFAQAFPLIGLVAAAALCFRPLRWLARSLRLVGGRLPRGVRLGVRRTVIAPGLTAMLIVAVTVASGCFALSRALSASSQQQLVDKAKTYVGSDLSLQIFDPVPPGSLGDNATPIFRYRGRLDVKSLAVMGVDRATFLHVARMRADGAGQSLEEMLAAITPTSADAVPAIFVGPDPPSGVIDVESALAANGITLDVVASAEFFPGVPPSGTMAVVDAELLEQRVTYVQRFLWVRDPTADAVEQWREVLRVGNIQRATEVFDTSNYRAQKWSYVPLAALGLLFAIVGIALQLLIVEARGNNRRQAHVVMSRTGFSRRSLWVAAIVEVGVPAVIGALLGSAVGVAVARVAVRHLDSLPRILPPARLVVPLGSFLVLALGIAIAVVAIAGLVVRSTVRGDQMEAIRGTP